MILVADIGGFNSRWGFYKAQSGKLRLMKVEQKPTSEIGNLPEALQAFTRQNNGTIDAIAIGIAGPVHGNEGKTTNSACVVRTGDIRERLGCENVFLLNDLEAQAHALPTLEESDRAILKPGRERAGTQGLIAVGAGLGESLLVKEGDERIVVPSEAGHADFGPTDAEEAELLRFLSERYEHVSWERVLSGTFGFRNLFEFYLRKSGRPHPLEGKLEETHLGPAIQQAAEKGDELALKVVRMFVKVYGAEAGNLALRGLTVGGVFVAGGIAQRLLPWLSTGEFAQAFLAKGRLSVVLHEIPVYLVNEPYLGLKGAAEYARNKARVEALSSPRRKVRDLMHLAPVTVRPDATVSVVRDLMFAKGIRHVPVMTGPEDLQGMISDRDVAGQASDTKVRDLMTRSVVTVSPEESLASAGKMMVGTRFHCLPVVEMGRLVGIITSSDLVSAAR